MRIRFPRHHSARCWYTIASELAQIQKQGEFGSGLACAGDHTYAGNACHTCNIPNAQIARKCMAEAYLQGCTFPGDLDNPFRSAALEAAPQRCVVHAMQLLHAVEDIQDLHA